MLCPKCGTRMKVKDKSSKGDSVDEYEAERIYICPNCGHLLKSSEVVVAVDIPYSTLR